MAPSNLSQAHTLSPSQHLQTHFGCAGSRKEYDYTDETLYFESGPHLGDLAVNLALGATLIWLPLSVAAAGRSAFVKYRFTDRRLSCITTAPWKSEWAGLAGLGKRVVKQSFIQGR